MIRRYILWALGSTIDTITLPGLETEVAVTDIRMCFVWRNLSRKCYAIFIYLMYSCCGKVHCFVTCQLKAAKITPGAHSERNYQSKYVVSKWHLDETCSKEKANHTARLPWNTLTSNSLPISSGLTHRTPLQDSTGQKLLTYSFAIWLGVFQYSWTLYFTLVTAHMLTLTEYINAIKYTLNCSDHNAPTGACTK